jgi:hypothetical protein
MPTPLPQPPATPSARAMSIFDVGIDLSQKEGDPLYEIFSGHEDQAKKDNWTLTILEAFQADAVTAAAEVAKSTPKCNDRNLA